jgi:lipid A 3-O-deacylase
MGFTRNNILVIIIFFILPLFSSGKKLDSLNYENHKEFYFNWDNDIFLFRDFYYTQGAKLFYVNPILRKNPANHILFRLKNADYYYGIGIVQEIYTPKNISNTLLDTIDQPYAGALYLRSFSTSINPQKKIRLSSQLDLGFLGPLSGAAQAQKYMHEWLGSRPPLGWDFQIENRPYINYNLILEKGIFSHPGIFDFIGASQVRLGNIHDDLQISTTFRFGRLNDYFKGLNLSNKKYKENRDFQFFIFGSANARGVLYNATLMGGIIPPDRNHQFKFNEIKNFVGELSGGAQVTYKFISLKGNVVWKTPEFETGESHGWGTISMFFRL